MSEFNWKGIAWCVAIALFCIITMSVIAHAEPDNLTFGNQSYVIVETIAGPVNITKYVPVTNGTVSGIPPYIHQGQTIYIGDTVDISGVVPPYPQVAYWDGYDIYEDSPSYNISMPDRKSGYYRFYVDPEIFSGRTGRWYKYSGTFEQRGNNLAFVVKPRPFYNYTLTFSNGTSIDVSEIPPVVYQHADKEPEPELMPPRHISDYLVTTDEPFNITTSELSACWIFNGDDNSIAYAVNDTENQIVFDSTQIGYLEPGDYKILIQTVGNISNNFDVVFADGHIKWFDRSIFAVHDIPAQNLVPSEAIRTLEQIFPLTYDSYEILNLSVQEPEITINNMDQVSVGSAKEYWKDSTLRGNVSLMDVRGYTNVLPGTNITVTLDETRNNPRDIAKHYTFRTTAKGSYLGDMRYYQVYVPLYWDSLAPGMHNLTARTEKGGEVVVNFPVTEMPADSFIPDQTIRFIGDRNPWVPTPTPEIIVKKETVVVTQTVQIPQTPSPEQISDEAKKLLQEQEKQRGELATIGIVVLAGLALLGWFGYSLWRARKGEKK